MLKCEQGLLVLLAVLVSCPGAMAYSWSPPQPAVARLDWYAFLGSSAADRGRGVAVDPNGYTYVVGYSDKTWGSPIRSHDGYWLNTFVVKLNASGALQWNTFLGGQGNVYGYAIALDKSGNIYVTGYSNVTWDTPIRSFTGNGDAYAAKLDNNGNLLWNTFLGGSDSDDGFAVAVDASGNVYVAGESHATWGSPINPFAGAGDAFVSKLDSGGALVWNSFLGGSGTESARAISLDASGNIYLAGQSFSTWGAPILPIVGSWDAFVAKLDSNAVLQWNTFLGGVSMDFGYSIALETGGNIYVAGQSGATWGAPVMPFAGNYDAFAAKLNNSGVLQWNTFLGGSGEDYALGIAVDSAGNADVAGKSNASWGAPLRPFAGQDDGFVAKLDNGGVLRWNLFLGGSGYDYGYGIAVDGSGSIHVAGESSAAWGTPVSPYVGDYDAFVLRIACPSESGPRHAVGDFDGDGVEEVVVDFGASGAKMCDSGVWIQLTASDPESLLAANVDGNNREEIITDLGSAGLWLWNSGAWSQLSALDAESLAAGDVDADGSDELVGDFGAAGLWLWNGGVWTQLSGVNADSMTIGKLTGAGGKEIVGDFNAVGLWVRSSGVWTQLSGVNADYVTCGDTDGDGVEELVGDFGATGLWLWNAGAWTQLSGVNADYMITADLDGTGGKEIVGDFGTIGLWIWNSGVWTELSGVNEDYMIRGDTDGDGLNEVAVDFGPLGVWLWNGGAWAQLSGLNPEYLMAADPDGDNKDEILGDFGGLGLWMWNEGAWSQISAGNPD